MKITLNIIGLLFTTTIIISACNIQAKNGEQLTLAPPTGSSKQQMEDFTDEVLNEWQTENESLRILEAEKAKKQAVLDQLKRKIFIISLELNELNQSVKQNTTEVHRKRHEIQNIRKEILQLILTIHGLIAKEIHQLRLTIDDLCENNQCTPQEGHNEQSEQESMRNQQLIEQKKRHLELLNKEINTLLEIISNL